MTDQATPAKVRLTDGLGPMLPAVRYWLCCGSTVYPHGAESCIEALAGHTERQRFGTADEHSAWATGRRVSGPNAAING